MEGPSGLNLIIPTYGRLNNQKTFNCLPVKYQRQVIFVIRPEEFDAFKKTYPHNIIHCLPHSVKNFAATKQWIKNTFRKSCVFIMDDNINSFHTIEKNGDKFERNPLTDTQFNALFIRITEYLKTYAHGGLILDKVSPPKGTSEMINSRIMTNIFADFSKWPDDVNFDDHPSCVAAEDFYTNLCLLTRGFQNVVISDIGVTKTMREKGGCNTYRNVDNHNKSMEALHARFPDVTKLKLKILTTGQWKGQEVYGITCLWKKAYRSPKL